MRLSQFGPKYVGVYPGYLEIKQGGVSDPALHPTTRLDTLTPSRVWWAQMTRLSKLMAVLLLALWLPATQHCALEAVGALTVICDDHGASGESVCQDGCGPLEDGNYKPATNTAKLPAPGVFACACFICLQLEVSAPSESLALAGDTVSARAEAWVPNWQFVRRAAPLPGAPNCQLA